MNRSLIVLLLCAACSAQVINAGSGITGGKTVSQSQPGISVVSATFYVSPAGSDSNNGTSVGTPFLTFDKARQAIQPLPCTKAYSVLFLGGTYYNSTTNFTSADARTSSCPVTYQNYPGQTAIMSGGMPATSLPGASGSWSTSITGTCALAHTNGFTCYQMTLPITTAVFEALFYNGVRRFRPRIGVTSSSNLIGGNGSVAGAVTAGCPAANPCGFTYNTADASAPLSVTNWASCATSAHPCEYWTPGQWTASVMRIQSITPGTHTIISTCTTNNNCPAGPSASGAKNYQTGQRYWIENVKELLGWCGQWYLDQSTNPYTLTYVACPGENPNTDLVVVGKNNQIISTTVTSGTGCGGAGCSLQWTTFEGLQFQNDNYTVPATSYDSLQLDPNMPNAMVSCNACANVLFLGNTFTQTIANAFEFIGGSTTSSIITSTFYDIGGYGIRIGKKPTGSETDSNVPNSIQVQQNGITGTGRFFPSSDDIMLGLANNIDVGNNELTYSYHDGIEACMPVGGFCKGGATSHGLFNINIHDNKIANIMLGLTSDGGGIYMMDTLSVGGGNCVSPTTAGSGNVIQHNWIHDVNDAHNQDPTGYGGQGIYADSCSGGILIKNNLIYRVTSTALKMTNGPQSAGLANTYQNNIIGPELGTVLGVQKCPNSGSGTQQFVFKNNLVYLDNAGTNMQFGTAYYPGTGNSCTGPFSGDPKTTQSFQQNLYFSSAQNLSTTSGVFIQHRVCSDGNQGSSVCSFANFATWQAFGEDQVGVANVNPNFGNPAPCSRSGNPNLEPILGVCDDYSLLVSPIAGFVPFSMTFGRSVPSPLPTVPDTFVISVKAPSAF